MEKQCVPAACDIKLYSKIEQLSHTMTPHKNMFSRCPIMGNHGKPGSTLTPQKKVTSRMDTTLKTSSISCCSSGGIYKNIWRIFTTTQLYSTCKDIDCLLFWKVVVSWQNLGSGQKVCTQSHGYKVCRACHPQPSCHMGGKWHSHSSHLFPVHGLRSHRSNRGACQEPRTR